MTTPSPPPALLPRRIRRLTDGAVVLVFAAMLGAVVAGTLFNPLPAWDENRPRHSPPPAPHDADTLRHYPKGFDDSFADRVGFRDVLLRWHNTALAQGFGEEDERKVWKGADGWLFMNVADPDEFRDDRPPLDARYDAWADELAGRATHLKGKGIEYVVVLAPEKSSVFPEHLPDRIRQHPPPDPLAPMSDRLKARGVRAVNPLPALLAAKATADRPLYYHQDTHWTQTGARVGFHQLAAELRMTHPEWRPLADDKYTPTAIPGAADLRRFVRGGGGPIPPTVAYTPPHPTAQRLDPLFAAHLPRSCLGPTLPPSVWTCLDATGPPAVVFCDSFGIQMLPFLSAEFRRAAVVLSDTIEPEVVEAERPAVVIQVLVGRKFYTTPPPERRDR